jgi:nucleoid-associated protein YgaU
MGDRALWDTMRGTAWVLLAAVALGALRAAILALRAATVRYTGPGQRRPGPARRLALHLGSLAGLALTTTWSPAGAQPTTSPPGRSRLRSESTRSETGGYPPPRPLVRTGPRSHPALHGRPRRSGRGDDQIYPLFPRAGRERRERNEGGEPRADGSHHRRRDSEGLYLYSPVERAPAHRGASRKKGRCRIRRYTVRLGESLWSIAGDSLHTQDGTRIASYWPRIYRANRRVIGSDPDLIHPGQALRLPPECGR